MNIRIPIKKIISGGIILLLSSSFVFADEDRHLAVDQAIGGMEQGSRISAPDAKGTAPLTDVHKTISSPQGIKKGESSSSTVGSNHGNIYSAPGQDNPVNPEEKPIIQHAHKNNKGILIKKALASGHIQKIAGKDPVRQSFQFIFQEPGVTSVIAGTINPKHLIENASYLQHNA